MIIKAHIPTQTYGFIEVSGDSTEKANIESLYNEYAESPIAFRKGTTQRLIDFFGNEIDYDGKNHVYSWNGEIYLSGSQYAKQFEKPFDGRTIAAKMAVKYKVKPEDIMTMWGLKARTSREFGTSLHSALELYGRFSSLAVALERDTAMHDHPVIKTAVQSFYKGRESEKAEYEVLIVDHKTKRAGRIDRLLVTGSKQCQVQDFKCNAVMDKAKLKVYWKQLNFYGEILKANGWKVKPPQIFHYNGTWTTYNIEKETKKMEKK